jgi:glycine/D-amino acid oxidase-like deaminating enzyme
MASHSFRPHIAVIGAGAFGGWTALHLLQQGARVTLIDAWGPGNARASSGGETRIIRGMYGPDPVYTKWVARALDLWQSYGKQWDMQCYFKTGALWMFTIDDDHYARAALPVLNANGLPTYELSVAEAWSRFPQIRFDDVRSVFYEEEAGYLKARKACRVICKQFVAAGGTYRQAAGAPSLIRQNRLESLSLSDGTTLRADAFVFACGPWLGSLFPEHLGSTLHPSRQSILYFGVPAGDRRFGPDQCPAWIEFGERIFYGLPDGIRRGFKIADDTRGPTFDPTHDSRVPISDDIENTRCCLEHRFPALKDAPLLEARVCQYTNSPDGDLIIDRHPGADNVWLVGGGSGHGFKLGPALGEHVADLVLNAEQPDAKFALSRFADPSQTTTQFQHK